MEELRKQLAAKLKELGVTQVSISYSGYGDSGQIESVIVSPEIDTHAAFDVIQHPWYPEKTMNRSLGNGLTDLAWSVIEKHYPGYENNDGGQGEIEWNVVVDLITLDHSWNVTTTEHEATLEL